MENCRKIVEKKREKTKKTGLVEEVGGNSDLKQKKPKINKKIKKNSLTWNRNTFQQCETK